MAKQQKPKGAWSPSAKELSEAWNKREADLCDARAACEKARGVLEIIIAAIENSDDSERPQLPGTSRLALDNALYAVTALIEHAEQMMDDPKFRGRLIAPAEVPHGQA